MNKPTIIVCPQNLLSHYLRCLMVADVMRKDFEFLFMSSALYNQWVTDYGFEIIETECNSISKVIAKAATFDFSWINYKDMKGSVSRFIQIFRKYKPDFVLGDAIPELKIATKTAGIPLIALVNGYMSRYYNDLRPVPHSHKSQKYRHLMSENAWNNIVRYAETIAMFYVHKPMRNLRKEFNLPRLYNFLDEFTGDFTLICDNTKLFPLKKLPPKTYIIGPLFYHTDKPEKELLLWFNSRPKAKTIFVSLGSSALDINTDIFRHPFFKVYNIIIAGKSGISNEQNIYMSSFINIQTVAEHVDLFICHGGNGSIYQALYNCIPLIMIPSIFEQEWNAYRVEKLKMGSIHYPDSPVEELHALVSKWIVSGYNRTHEQMSAYLRKENTEGLIKKAFMDILIR